MAKPWDKTKQKRERETQRLRSLHRYLIVSEDEKSSRLYLQSFPHDPNIVQIVTEGGAGNTISVVERGIELKSRAQKDKVPYVQTFCVIDRDEHPVDRYRKAFEEAKKTMISKSFGRTRHSNSGISYTLPTTMRRFTGTN